MTREELERYLNVGRSRSVCVSVDVPEEFPGYVRTVTVMAGNIIAIELQPHGSDEGGPTFHATYPSLEEAIAAVEAFLGRSLSAWSNASVQESPELPTGVDVSEGHERLRDAVKNGTVHLPRGPFRIQEDGYWSRLAGITL